MVCLYLNLQKKYTCSNTNRREDLESCWPGRSCRCQNNKVKRCRFVEVKNGLSLSQIVAFFRQVLLPVGVLEQDCRYIFCKFGAMSLVAKNPWKASVESANSATFPSQKSGVTLFQLKWPIDEINLKKENRHSKTPVTFL